MEPKRNVELRGILGKERLEFRDNAELERYYEDKYSRGGYEGGGCILHGTNISRLYHRARHDSAFRFLDPAAEDVILDAGCGDGSLSARLAPHCRSVHAIDIAGNALDPAHRALPNLAFSKMNVEDLRFPDAAFSKVVSVETLEHLLDPARALAEMHRVLVPGGRLVLTYPTVNRTRVQELQKRLGIGRPLAISEHLTEWSYDDVVRNGRAAGFEFVESEGIAFDFGAAGWIKYKSRFFAKHLTTLALALTRFPRNSAFVSLRFRKP